MTYQPFTAVLLLIYGSLILSGIYYCLCVFWCAAARMSELELEQRTNIKFLYKLGKSGNEIREMLVQVYGDNAVKKTAVYKWVKRFSRKTYHRVTVRVHLNQTLSVLLLGPSSHFKCWCSPLQKISHSRTHTASTRLAEFKLRDRWGTACCCEKALPGLKLEIRTSLRSRTRMSAVLFRLFEHCIVPPY
jgi:hypothetical protein